MNGPALEPVGQLRPVPSGERAPSLAGIGFECLDRFMFEQGRCYDKLAQTGTKWARCQTGWCRCETVRGQYDFAWLDDVVDNLLRRGIQPWFNVGFGNKLYMPDAYGEAAVGHVPLYYGDETLEAWRRFIRALSRHFRGRVFEWEIWNESDIEHFWQPAHPDPLEYLRLIELTGAIIREEIPDVRIGSCISHIYGTFLIELIRGGLARAVDFHAVHTYRIVAERDFPMEIAALRQMLDSHGGQHVRIWTGEAGHPSCFPKNHWLHPVVPGSEINQAKWILRRSVTGLRVGMERSSFFQMVDMTRRPYQMAKTTNAAPARHGILHGGSYEPKRSFLAMSHFNAVFDGDTYLCPLYASLNLDDTHSGRQPASRLANVAAITANFVGHGRPLYAYHLPEDVQVAYPGAESVSLGVLDETDRVIETPVLVDLLSGGVYDLAPVTRQTARGCMGFGPLPLRDYPSVVMDRASLDGRIVT